METGSWLPPSGRAILAEFMNSPIDFMQGQCRHCGGDVLEFPDGRRTCEHCGLPFEPEQEASGVPAELRPEIAGAPLTEGILGQGEHTDPYDTGAHGRDEYTHGHVIAALFPEPTEEQCERCGGHRMRMPDGGSYCDDCGQVMLPPYHEQTKLPPSGEWAGARTGPAFEAPKPPNFIQRMFANNVLAAIVESNWEDLSDPLDKLHCPQCHEPVIRDQQAEAVFCPTCNHEWPIYRDEPWGDQHFDPRELAHGLPREPTVVPSGAWGPVHEGANEMEGIVFADTPAQQNNMKWTPGMVGGGLVIGGEPHTWNRRDPNGTGEDDLAHKEYTRMLGVHPRHVDWTNAIHINPDGSIPNEFGKHDPTPFIAADPRLKPVEGQTPSGPTMANHSRTNNMEPYETLWSIAGIAEDIGEGATVMALGGPEDPVADLAGMTIGKSLGSAAGGIMGKVMGGGQGSQAQAPAEAYQSPLQQFTHVLAAFVESDYETPASNPDVGVKHDDPEDVDQKEFNDQDKNPENLLNPNLQDSGASGEDQVRNDAGKPSQGQFAPDSPAIQRLEMLMPLIEKYYHSEESGANDPMIKKLHEMLEAENPGYLNQADPEIAERYMQGKKQPEHVHAAVFPTQGDEPNPRILAENSIPCPRCHGKGCPDCAFAGFIPERRMTPRPNESPRAASVKEAIVPPMQQGNLQAEQAALDPTALNPSQQPMPSSAIPPGGGLQGGHCKNCGSVTQANGACPNCGTNNQQAEGAGQLPGGPSTAPTPQMFAHTDLLASLIEGANHQGPVTPEQVAAVQQYLIQKGRVDEVPNVPLDPGNPEYAKILAEIQQNPENVPTVTPEEQTQPPPPQPAAPGGMPVPGMAPGEAGGQPMQPMASFLPELDFSTHTGADNIAPRCPKCGSATTGVVGDNDHHAKCHACHNIWKMENVFSDENYGQTSVAKIALRDERPYGGQGEQANPVGVPAADQSQQTNQGRDEDSSLTWQDTAGAPLKAGQTYQMVNPSYSLPDLVRVERVKPDGIDVTLLGTFANDLTQHDPNTLTSSTPISKEDADIQQLSFEPVNQTADDRNNEPPPGSAAPGLAQVPPSGQTTDEQAAQEPQMAAHSRVEHDPDCPRCGSFEFTSAMITAEATEHNCFRCGHDWVTEEKDEHLGVAQREGWTNPSADWLNEDEDAEDFSQRRFEMARAGAQSRSLAEIAEKDDRLRATRAYLAQEGRERQERLAGKHFTPREQRELIDEDGFARNSDMLDLSNTHYEVRDDYESKTNPERVRDADLFLGI